ncbi:unnamed protein product [Prorocentrum cordatum]|uniref:Autophagy-related protein 9 n=1 Tax=Prorocentrum cordatum TaxID=2364126 RepID=A0ABN9WC19_9DINO|nr:unnamed protein product [Polarella glacialis]
MVFGVVSGSLSPFGTTDTLAVRIPALVASLYWLRAARFAARLEGRAPLCSWSLEPPFLHSFALSLLGAPERKDSQPHRKEHVVACAPGFVQLHGTGGKVHQGLTVRQQADGYPRQGVAAYFELVLGVEADFDMAYDQMVQGEVRVEDEGADGKGTVPGNSAAVAEMVQYAMKSSALPERLPKARRALRRAQVASMRRVGIDFWPGRRARPQRAAAEWGGEVTGFTDPGLEPGAAPAIPWTIPVPTSCCSSGGIQPELRETDSEAGTDKSGRLRALPSVPPVRGDVFTLGRLLELAGTNLDLDHTFDGLSLRQAGTALEVRAVYSNMYHFYSFFGYREVNYHYEASELVMPAMEQYVLSAAQPEDLAASTPELVDGRFGFFSVVNFFVIVVAAAALVRSAKMLVDLCAVYVHPNKPNYFHLKYEVSGDFSSMWNLRPPGPVV